MPFYKRKARPRSVEERGRAEGYRSGLEDKIADELKAAGIEYEYESLTIPYTLPAKRYTPDYLILSNGIIVETKGRFVSSDRTKHRQVKAQHPDLDIRFVFSNSRQRIGKKSETTYGMWCDRFGFQYADKSIPAEWLSEPPMKKRMEALKKVKRK